MPQVKITDTEVLGKLLRNKRKSQEMTIDDISMFTGLSSRFISEVERGKPTAEIGKILQLMQTVGIDFFADDRS